MINIILKVLIEMVSIKILKLNMILKVLIEMAYIKILKLYMILMVLIEMACIKILKLYMILRVLINMVMIFMIIEKNQAKLKLGKQNLLKIKKEKDMSIYLLLYLKIYTNNSSKELINNIKQLINDLYDTKQITKQVYNNLIKAMAYG